MPKSPAGLDLDARFAKRLQRNVDDALIVPLTLGGREWHLTDSGSVVASLDAIRGDDDAIMDWVTNFVVDEEADEFRSMLRKLRGLDGEILGEMTEAILEALSDRPTEPSQPSSGTSPRKRSAPRSTANSSSQVRRV